VLTTYLSHSDSEGAGAWKKGEQYGISKLLRDRALNLLTVMPFFCHAAGLLIVIALVSKPVPSWQQICQSCGPGNGLMDQAT
jgi:hypothetical protein